MPTFRARIVTVSLLAFPFFAALGADPGYTNPPAPMARNALVHPGVSFEGDGECWTPGQNQERTRVGKYHFKLMIDTLEGEKFVGKWHWERGSDNTVDRIEGTFTNGNKLKFAFTKRLSGTNTADQGSAAVGTISLQGEVRISFDKPNSGRLGEFIGARKPPVGK